MTKINIMAIRHSAFYSPLLISIAGNYLKEEGLVPEYSLATPDKTIRDSLQYGTCHVAQSAVATCFEDLEQGSRSDIVHFAQINARDGFFIAAREPDNAFSWHKLIGRDVLVDHFFQPMAMFNYALHKKGISPGELNIIDAGNVEQIEQAFRDGKGDYVHMQGPAPQQMEEEGIAHVVASVGKVVGPVAFSSLCSTRDWLETDMARAFMKAYSGSLEFVVNASAEEIAFLELKAGFFPDIDQQVLTRTIQDYKDLGCWEIDPIISRQSYENLLGVFIHSELIKHRYPYERAVMPPPPVS